MVFVHMFVIAEGATEGATVGVFERTGGVPVGLRTGALVGYLVGGEESSTQ